MKPVESFEAERAFRSGKAVFALDKGTNELYVLYGNMNNGFITNVFVQPFYLYYIYGGKDE